MDFNALYLYAADGVLFSHVLFVAFVIFGLLIVFAGKAYSWSWVRNPVFRLLHLSAIGIVVVQSWFGIVCPLTTLENLLREKAGTMTYEGTFVSHWMRTLLYYDAPNWVFAVIYTGFGVLVLASWYYVRPDSFSAKGAPHGK